MMNVPSSRSGKEVSRNLALACHPMTITIAGGGAEFIEVHIT